MLQAQASERGLIDQFLAALRSLSELQAELESACIPGQCALRATSPAGLSARSSNLGRSYTCTTSVKSGGSGTLLAIGPPARC